jgi:hypothetical protein
MIQNYNIFKRWNAKSDKIYIFNFKKKNHIPFIKWSRWILLASFDSWEHQTLTLSRWMTDQDIVQQACVTSYNLRVPCLSSLCSIQVAFSQSWQSRLFYGEVFIFLLLWQVGCDQIPPSIDWDQLYCNKTVSN